MGTSPNEARMATQNMDRFVLRLVILYEFYKAEHSTTGSCSSIALPVINEMDVPEAERSAALRYLIGSGLLMGKNQNAGGGRLIPFPSRISHAGIDFIESAVCKASFDSTKDHLEEGESLDGYTGRLRVLGRLLPKIIKGDSSKYIADLVAALAKNACQLISGFA